MPGIRIRHRTLRSQIHLIPILSKPLLHDSLHECGACHVTHPVKTIHLWLDDTGSATVSQGVYDDMATGWTGEPEYDVVSEVEKPPPVSMNGDRTESDYNGRKIIYRR